MENSNYINPFQRAINHLAEAMLSRNGSIISTNIDDYTPFQKAVLLEDIEECRRLARDDQFGEMKNDGISHTGMITVLEIKGELELAAYVFRKMPDQEKLFYLVSIKNTHFSLIDFLWNDVPDNVQEKMLTMHFDPDIVLALFQKSTDETQEKVWLHYLFLHKETPILALSLWHITKPSVKERLIMHRNKYGHSILGIAIYSHHLSIIPELLKEIRLVHSLSDEEKTPLESALACEEKLGSELIESFKEADAGFTEEIEALRMMGHLFELEEGLFKGGVSKYFSHVSRQMASNAIQAWKKHQELVSVLECRETDPKTLAARALLEPTLISCGWKSHAIKCLFWGDLCVKIDTGVSQLRGIRFYKMGNVTALEEVIRTLLEMQERNASEDEGLTFLDDEGTMDTLLKEDLAFWIRYCQKGGSCEISSLKVAIYAYFVLKELKEQGLEPTEENYALCAAKVDRDYRNYSIVLKMVFNARVVSSFESKYDTDPTIQMNFQMLLDVAIPYFEPFTR